MIKMSEIVKSSVPAFSITMTENKHHLKYMAYMRLNSSWLQRFNKIIFCINGDANTATDFMYMFNETYPSLKTKLIYRENLGHTFGTLDADLATWEYAKQNPDIEYIWKFAGDTLANTSIFDIEIDDSCDFFYINNVGTPSLINKTKEQLLEDMMSQKYFYPQTNYYIYKNKIQRWYPLRDNIIKLKNMYDEIKKEHPNYYPWDAISKEDAGLPADANSGCACEAFLAQTVIENNLKKQCLLSREDTKKILDLIDEYGIGDGSHKNILYTNVGGLCHYHIMNGQAVPI